MGAVAPYAARNNHTPLRGEQQATIYYDRWIGEDVRKKMDFS